MERHRHARTSRAFWQLTGGVCCAALARLFMQSPLETSLVLPALAGWFVLMSRPARGFPREFLLKMALGKDSRTGWRNSS